MRQKLVLAEMHEWERVVNYDAAGVGKTSLLLR